METLKISKNTETESRSVRPEAQALAREKGGVPLKIAAGDGPLQPKALVVPNLSMDGESERALSQQRFRGKRVVPRIILKSRPLTSSIIIVWS